MTSEDTLAQIGASVERIPAAQYTLAGAVVRRGVNAFNVNTFLSAGGVPAIGVTVVNIFPDGNGDLPQQTDGSGVARFQYGASSAFSAPGAGPFTVFATDSASKSDPPNPRVTSGAKLSDVVHSLGDFQGTHTEIYLQFVERSAAPPPVVVPPDLVPMLTHPFEAPLRVLAWHMRGVTLNPDAALYKFARGINAGYPLSPEFEFMDEIGTRYVAQLFSGVIVYCLIGDWAHVNVVKWL
jgi:hypothetical protein